MDLILKKAISESQRRYEKRDKKRKCMYCGCQNKAIKSHVLQKNGVINQISEGQHVMQLCIASIFEYESKGFLEIKSVWVNNAYTFNWFCLEHDTGIFQSIEVGQNLDLYDPQQQALFSYRWLCQEIRRKQQMIEHLIWVRDLLPRGSFDSNFQKIIDWYKNGEANMNYFKEKIEHDLSTWDFSEFYFETIQIPKIDLCISVPLNIEELSAEEEAKNIEKFANWVFEPYLISFISIFPKGEYSYAIFGYHKEYPCEWTKNLILKLKSGHRWVILKELSDLIVLRLEFWTMSPDLFRSIPRGKIEEYKEIFSENAMNHSPSLATNLNLFDGL